MSGSLSRSSLSADLLRQFEGIVGEKYVSTRHPDRLIHSRDMWPRTVLWTKRGHFPYLPDAIISPENTKEISQILSLAEQNHIPVVPYGAGSGVCAGTLPIRGGVILNMKRMNRLVQVDKESLIAEIEPGLYGETLEKQLEPQGYTMGHFPSSIYCSTVGGYLAARSAGQMSSRYGKIEDMVVGLEFVLPDGSIHQTDRVPTGSSRIDWRQILIGSEGTLGVITKAWMQVHPLPAHRCFQGYHFEGIRPALSAMQQIMQAGLEPSVLRLYDEFDTLVAGTHGETDPEALPGSYLRLSPAQRALSDIVGQLKKQSLAPALKRTRWLNLAVDQLPQKTLVVILTEGEKDLAEHEMRQIQTLCEAQQATGLGEAPGRYWLAHRHAISYKQSKIFDSGSWVDTMEVAAPWSSIERLYLAVKKTVQKDVFIMAHFSHAYRDGCCIYFSFASSSNTTKEMEATHDRVWANALEAVHRFGGTITHHHGVGMSKGHMMPVELNELWPLLRRIKTGLDPYNIMNPGKLGHP